MKNQNSESRKVIEYYPGQTIQEAVELAKKIACTEKVIVEFDFNGRLVRVSETTYLDSLYRDFNNSFYLGTKIIGPDPKWRLSAEEELTLGKAIQKSAEERKQREEKQAEEDRQKREVLEAKSEGIEFALKPNKKEEYRACVEKNSKDSYSKGVIDYAKRWACLMQKELQDGAKLVDIADRTSHEADIEGITGFMYSAAVSSLAEFWEYGNELKRWHNGEYGQPDAEGVVNPAVLTIRKKESA